MWNITFLGLLMFCDFAQNLKCLSQRLPNPGLIQKFLDEGRQQIISQPTQVTFYILYFYRLAMTYWIYLTFAEPTQYISSLMVGLFSILNAETEGRKVSFCASYSLLAEAVTYTFTAWRREGCRIYLICIWCMFV